MKILHTSDWHLGRQLYDRKRYQEFSQFLDWLAQIIEQNSINTLLICGDVFESRTPSNRAQELYYRFLFNISKFRCCRHVVVIGGNHDSPSFLNAPKELLRILNVYVVGSVTDNLEDEVLVLKDNENIPEAIVCAVPYLRDKDIRKVEAGETNEDKNKKLLEGVRKHYSEVGKIAQQKQNELGDVPIIAMGHLFTAGGKIVEGDGVRELYIGTLAHVGAEVFPSCIDYLALGHLHVYQRVGQSKHLRYSGSPISMGFGEAHQEKQVLQVQLNGKETQVDKITVPNFQPLEKITGELEDIRRKIEKLKNQPEKAKTWLEIEYTGTEMVSNLSEFIEELLVGSKMEIRRIINRRVVDQIINKMDQNETLDDLGEKEIFIRCLNAHKIEEKERPALIESYNEILTSLYEEDINAV